MKEIDPRTRKMLTTLRAALIMGAKAIEEYLRDEAAEVVVSSGENVILTSDVKG